MPELTAITTAELYQGVAMAEDASSRAARTEKLGAAIVEFEPLPFDGSAAARYGSVSSLRMLVSCACPSSSLFRVSSACLS